MISPFPTKGNLPGRGMGKSVEAVSWLTSDVVALSRAAYDERHFPSGELELHRLAVLADALEEAGATGDLVAHLCSPGPHGRGCFAVDLCLGLS